MRLAYALALFAVAAPCFAQKWVDEKGKVYYGAPPPGIRVKPAPMTGGATSNVGSQGGGAPAARAAPDQKNWLQDPKLPWDPNDPKFKPQPFPAPQQRSQGASPQPQYREPGAQSPLKGRELPSSGSRE